MQTWKNTVVPDKWKSSPASIRQYMPDWEYVLMTDEMNDQFVKTYFPDFYHYYVNFPYPIQRADAIRYMWLYKHGGIYMDMDFELIRPLDDLFTSGSDAFFVKSGNLGSWYTNAFMASTPGNKIWLECLEAMKADLPWWCVGKHLQVHNSTGPLMLTSVINKTTQVYSVLPRKYIMPCSVCKLPCTKPSAYIKVLPGSSWAGLDTQIYLFFMCNWKPVLVLFALILVLIILYFIIKLIRYIAG